MRVVCLFIGLALAIAPTVSAADILIADFEQDNYGDWEVEGEAFGPGPAKGTFKGQMHVSGFKGKRLVNTFFNGDGTTGTLTSPPIKIERDYLTFLVGGGAHRGKTCMNLLLDGKVVRTVTGANDRPGGTESLEPAFWDLRDLKGKSVVIQIVDSHKGGWGHVNVDHIVQSNTKPKAPSLRAHEKSFTVENKYLIIPIKNGAKKTNLSLFVEGTEVRRYGTELAVGPDDVDWYAYFTIEAYRGKQASVKVARGTEEAFPLIKQADKVPGSEKWYSESLRPQFHFSQAVGWNNDPNGMVYHNGEWHLFFQHNPVGWKWGNMTWGHATSKDLVHWKQHPNKLFPGTMAKGACFSGGATVDKNNTAGWGKDTLVAFLTDTGAGEAIAYSNDNGRTFTWYEKNPVVKHRGRDPKVIWYAYDDNDKPLNDTAKKLGGHWVMVVYDEHPQHKRNAAFYTSTNLKEWTEQSHLPGYFECTELFELPIDGDKNNTRWVVFAADAKYAIGSFDGKTFKPDHQGKHQVHHGPYYASQTFDNSPDGRKIQIGWARMNFPGMPFNQAFSFPHELTLHKTADGIRMFAKPVKEIEKLHKKKHNVSGDSLPLSINVSGDLFDVRATFAIGSAKTVGLDIGGNVITYDANARKLNGAAMKPVNGRVSIQVLVDRPMIEICGNDGMVFITGGRGKKGNVSSIKAFGDGARLVSFEVNELKSIWK